MKYVIKTYGSFLFYTYFPYVLVILGKLLINFQYSNTNMDHVLWINFICDIAFFIVLSIINFDLFKKNAKFEGKDKKEKTKNFISNAVKLSLLLFGVKIISSYVEAILFAIFNISVETAANQQLAEELFKSAPFISVITGVLLAPFVEELLFRGAVRRIIKNKKVFVIVSGLLFGLVHVLRYDLPVFGILILGCIIDSIITSQQSKQKKIGLSLLASVIMFVIVGLSLHVLSGSLIGVITSIDMSEVINSVVYITMGVYFSIVFVKYDNIYLNIACHLVNNAVGYIILFTLL